jgi:hypothetical protein
MRGAISPLPNTPSWRGAQLAKKHRDNFTFTFLPQRLWGPPTSCNVLWSPPALSGGPATFRSESSPI